MDPRLWSDDVSKAELIAAVLELPRVPLVELEAPDQPGVYLQFLATPQLALVLGRSVATGQLTCRIGSAAHDLRERVGRARRSLVGMDPIDRHTLHVAVLPLASPALAAYAERLLIDMCKPPLDGLGLANQWPGAGRPGTRPSLIDALLPGRSRGVEPNEVDTALARAIFVRNLARRPAAAPRWPPLCPAAAA